MGDVIMTGPAIRALKETFQCNITLLTSGAAAGIASCIKEIDDVIIADLPWVKHNTLFDASMCLHLVQQLKERHFDAAIIFTVYSQSALPAALLTYLAGIPFRLAYCRENPYELLTDWVIDKEPFHFILHQVQRDLALVKQVGATTKCNDLQLHLSHKANVSMLQKLQQAGVHTSAKWILLHPGVSEAKRMYPVEQWVEIARMLEHDFHLQILLSGTKSEAPLAQAIADKANIKGIYNIAGLLNVQEFISCVQHTKLVITVNTATTHIAAAAKTPQVVLYAATNPQHTPWKSLSRVFYFPVQAELQSKNEIIRYVNGQWKHGAAGYPDPCAVLAGAKELMEE